MRQEGNPHKKSFAHRKGGHPNQRGGNNPNPRPQRNNEGGDGQQGTEHHFKKRFIKKDREGKGPRGGQGKKGGKRQHGKGEDRDLDRQLRDYWITHKGGDKTGDGKTGDLAKQKLNSELDDYWKNKKQQPKQAE